MVWAAAKKQIPQKQDEGCANVTQLLIPPSSTLSSPQVVDEVPSSSKAQPGMMRLAKGTSKPGEQAKVGEEDPQHEHSLGKTP